MKVYLIQHGEAVSKDIDPDRSLSDPGRADVNAIARFLRGAGVHPRAVWHSGKTRAQQTADLITQTLAAGDALQAVEGINPNDDVRSFAQRLNELSADTLVVGHLPFMAKLVAQLVVGDQERAVVSFEPGSAVCLERDAEGVWSLAWMVRPALLR